MAFSSGNIVLTLSSPYAPEHSTVHLSCKHNVTNGPVVFLKDDVQMAILDYNVTRVNDSNGQFSAVAVGDGSDLILFSVMVNDSGAWACQLPNISNGISPQENLAVLPFAGTFTTLWL